MKLLLSLLLLTNLSAFSQDSLIQHIDSIKQSYDYKIALSAEEDMDFFPPRFTINSTLMERAIGKVKNRTTIYFDNDVEESLYENVPIDIALIRKVDVSLSSGSYTILKHFYFNENSELIFYSYHEEGYECFEQTYYFAAKRCIQIAQQVMDGDGCNLDSELKNFKRQAPNSDDLKSIKSINNLVIKYKKLLKTYYTSLR